MKIHLFSRNLTLGNWKKEEKEMFNGVDESPVVAAAAFIDWGGAADASVVNQTKTKRIEKIFGRRF